MRVAVCIVKGCDAEGEPFCESHWWSDARAVRTVPATRELFYMDNPKACGAPAGSRWGYLPCGCSNDGHGRHIR